MSDAPPPDITPALARALLDAQFPHWADLPISRVEWDGWNNRTFRLGDYKTIRLPSAERYANQVCKEQLWLPRLAPQLPLPIPVPLAMGAPALGYLWHWSVYEWIEGETVAAERLDDMTAFATDLARFLTALQRCDTSDGPAAGPDNFFRGGSLAVYDAETRDTLLALDGVVDPVAAIAVWDAALAAQWDGRPVWVHGDVTVGNLLVREGQLSAVIDFGSCCVGDPACDLVIAWTFLDAHSRATFRATLAADASSWARARGWALWKALLVLRDAPRTHPAERPARQIVDIIIAEHAATR